MGEAHCRGVPSGAVFDTMERQNEPSFEERGIFRTVHRHNGDYKTMATWPMRIEGKTVRLKGSPALGQDSAEVLHNWLCTDAAVIEALRQDSIL